MKSKIKQIKNLLNRDELGILPASLTYYFVLAIIPILTLTVLIASSFNITIDEVITLINEVLPTKVSNFLVEIISGKGFDSNIGLFNIIALMIASNGTYAIIKTANSLYKVPKSDVIKDRIKSFIILFNIIFLLIFLIIVPVFGEKILLLCQDSKMFSFLSEEIMLLINIIKWPFTFFILFFNIKLVYTISISQKIESKNTTLGALITSTLWMLLAVIFGYYLDYFANYDILYGNLSSLIMLMIWLYVMSFVFVLGMIINKCYYEKINKHD